MVAQRRGSRHLVGRLPHGKGRLPVQALDFEERQEHHPRGCHQRPVMSDFWSALSLMRMELLSEISQSVTNNHESKIHTLARQPYSLWNTQKATAQIGEPYIHDPSTTKRKREGKYLQPSEPGRRTGIGKTDGHGTKEA